MIKLRMNYFVSYLHPKIICETKFNIHISAYMVPVYRNSLIIRSNPSLATDTQSNIYIYVYIILCITIPVTAG